ncbi:MAG: extra-cytoplasmic solute receptor protein [Herminiimonas sp.]|nr:extra-cytoplasmic solute receptor protein [Herminiimonas sp.]
MSIRRLYAMACTALLPILMLSPSAHAAAWPEKPVKIIVPYPAGGNTDSQARLIAQRLGAVYHQAFIVENKPGANGVIAAQYVAQSAPDGYTLLMSAVAQIAIAPAMERVTYDPVKSFTPISTVGSNPLVVAVSSEVPAKSIKELVDYSKTQANGMNYASAGSGSVPHLAAVLFFKRAGMKMVHVPYKGGAPALTDLLAGHVPLYFANVAEVLPYVKTGKIKLLAVTSAKRIPQLPDVPTIAESGFPDFAVHTWNGLLAPAGTPENVVADLSAHVQAAVKEPDTIKRLEALGISPVGDTPATFAASIRHDLEMWGSAVKLSGAKVD